MNKEDFIAKWNKDNLSRLSKFRSLPVIAVKCLCGQSGCVGWTMVPNDKQSIDHHNKYYFD